MKENLAKKGRKKSGSVPPLWRIGEKQVKDGQMVAALHSGGGWAKKRGIGEAEGD